jgi:3-oxoacyl-[acyl-carrier-protein] synthase-3
MRYDELYVAGYGTWLPAAMSADESIHSGLCEDRIVRETAMTAVTVEEHLSGPEMAVLAGRRALIHSGLFPTDIDLVTYSALYYPGHDMWAPASYVHREIVGGSCPAVEVRQTSNGGMAALDLAAGYLTADGSGSVRRAALLTTGDRFCEPGFDRWRSDPGTVFGDGGAALVLSRHGGFARLRSLVVGGDSELEEMHRGDDPFGPAPFSLRTPIDVHHTTRAYLRAVGTSYALSRMASGQAQVVKMALAEADIDLPQIDWCVLPNFGRRRMEANFFRRLGLDPSRTTWPWGRGIGHLGAGDQFAGLAHLMDSGLLRPGQRCAVIGVGGGFSWSCAVLEVL